MIRGILEGARGKYDLARMRTAVPRWKSGPKRDPWILHAMPLPLRLDQRGRERPPRRGQAEHSTSHRRRPLPQRPRRAGDRPPPPTDFVSAPTIPAQGCPRATLARGEVGRDTIT